MSNAQASPIIINSRIEFTLTKTESNKQGKNKDKIEESRREPRFKPQSVLDPPYQESGNLKILQKHKTV